MVTLKEYLLLNRQQNDHWKICHSHYLPQSFLSAISDLMFFYITISTLQLDISYIIGINGLNHHFKENNNVNSLQVTVTGHYQLQGIIRKHAKMNNQWYLHSFQNYCWIQILVDRYNWGILHHNYNRNEVHMCQCHSQHNHQHLQMKWKVKHKLQSFR